jgi:16S rRNA (cytosine1402-N4)-methyltransferase
LDMRMDQNTKQTAAEVLNTYSEEDLKRIFRLYGEVENAGYLASIIFHNRKDKQIETVNDLKTMIVKCVKRGRENQYYAQVFQALRIEVNKELDVLQDLLMQSLEVLKPGGRLVVISYHSLEDRLVKNIMRSGKFEGDVEKDFYGNPLTPFKQITRKPIVPSEKENEENSRARSAKLRIAEKK